MHIFENVTVTDVNHVVMEFINSIYAQDKFLWALPLIVGKKGCVVNEDYCLFPDLTDFDTESHFEGVMFGSVNAETVITESDCSKYIDDACSKYIQLHPTDMVKILDILKTRLI